MFWATRGFSSMEEFFKLSSHPDIIRQISNQLSGVFKEFYQREGADLGGCLIFQVAELSQFLWQILEATALPLLTNFIGKSATWIESNLKCFTIRSVRQKVRKYIT
jgi:hypothetical protein